MRCRGPAAGRRPTHQVDESFLNVFLLGTAVKIFEYIPHPHINWRKAREPSLSPPPEGALARFNAHLAGKITKGVGTMWCAYAFALLAFISLPEAIHTGTSALISWIAPT